MNLKYFFTGVVFLLGSSFFLWYIRRRKMGDGAGKTLQADFIRFWFGIITMAIVGIVLIIKSLT